MMVSKRWHFGVIGHNCLNTNAGTKILRFKDTKRKATWSNSKASHWETKGLWYKSRSAQKILRI